MRISDWSSDVCSSDLQDEQHDDKDGRFEQGFLDRADGARDQVGAVVKNIDMGACGQCAFDFRKAGADTIHHLPRIGAAQGDHQPLNRFGLTDFADRAIARQAAGSDRRQIAQPNDRSEEHTSELQSLMRITYAVYFLNKNTRINTTYIL